MIIDKYSDSRDDHIRHMFLIAPDMESPVVCLAAFDLHPLYAILHMQIVGTDISAWKLAKKDVGGLIKTHIFDELEYTEIFAHPPNPKIFSWMFKGEPIQTDKIEEIEGRWVVRARLIGE